MKIHRINLPKFQTFIAESGAELLPTTNGYEAVRFRCKEGVGVVYRSEKGHVSLTGAAVTAFQFFSRGRDWVAGRDYLAWERPEIVDRLRERDGDACFFCGKPLGQDVTVEHLLAIAHGGTSTDANLCLAHKACNTAAGSLPLVEKIRLFFDRKPNH